jgi:hypothetical protein
VICDVICGLPGHVVSCEIEVRYVTEVDAGVVDRPVELLREADVEVTEIVRGH